MTTPDARRTGTVSSLGVASCATSLGLDNWTVVLQLPASNAYFTAGDSDGAIVTVYAPATRRFRFAVGGGWIVDPSYLNLPVAISASDDHGNLGFSVEYSGRPMPIAQAVYTFRGANGYDYEIKSSSLSGPRPAIGRTTCHSPAGARSPSSTRRPGGS